jgi:hypothetical protein
MSPEQREEIVREVMDSMPQMKGWREAKIGWRVWTQEAILRALDAYNARQA